MTASEIADELRAPRALLGKLLGGLAKAGMLIEVAGKEARYSPARPLEHITVHEVLQGLRVGPEPESGERPPSNWPVIEQELAVIELAERQAASVLTVRDLAERSKVNPSAG